MEQKQEMHDVVEMLLNRIKDYPEDFYVVGGGYVYNKWLEALNTAKQVMRPEEKAAVESALEKAKRAVYMGAALKTMMGEDLPVEEEVISRKQYKHQTSSQLVFSGNGNVGIGSATATATATGITTKSTLLDAASHINQLESRLKQVEKQYATNNA